MQTYAMHALLYCIDIHGYSRTRELSLCKAHFAVQIVVVKF